MDRKINLKIAHLLRTGQAAEAIKFIDEGRKSHRGKFTHKLIDYLYSRASNYLSSELNRSPLQFSSATELKKRLLHNFTQEFRDKLKNNLDYQYQPTEAVADDISVAKLLKANSIAEQEKALPYKGKIYLPTNRYTELEQFKAIQKTAAFLSKANCRVSCAKFQALKKLVKDGGFNTCMIIANGPSLKSTNLAILNDTFLIGLNSIFLHPYITPHLIVCEDHLVGEDRSEELNKCSSSIKLIPGYLTYCVEPDDLTIVLNHRPRISFPVDIDFSDDIEKVTYTGGTVTYTALQIAIGLGFKEVELVGCDASYKVENVKEENNYATGILESLGDDPNHFNTSYFGKGYRWHDPNPLRMMQAYSVANRYASLRGINITNLSRGGMLEVFRRGDYLQKIYEYYPKVCVIDWIDINSKAATGEVKKVLFKDWPTDKLIHIFSPKPKEIKAFKSSVGDIFHADSESILSAWKAVIENDPDCFYWRPTHNRPILNLFACLLFLLEKKPFTLHLMDYWTVKVDEDKLRLAYEKALDESIKASAHLFVISERMKARICHRLDFELQSVSVAHNYVSTLKTLPLDKPVSAASDVKTIFYSGNLDPDQSIDPLIDICEAIKILNKQGPTRYEFILRTSEFHMKASGYRFSEYDFVTLQSQTDNFDDYIRQTAAADICILAYGFGSQSRLYLLDSMANKLPDLITANSRFFAYGDLEIGTLNYLKSVGYPFVFSERDPIKIGSQIEYIASMDDEAFANVCANAFSKIKDEFSEMAQCHVFQGNLTLASIDSTGSRDLATCYQRLITLYQEILTLSKIGLSNGLHQEFSLMLFLANNSELIGPVYESIRNHGITWSVNSTKDHLTKSINRLNDDANLLVQALAWMIVSQRHSRFIDLWTKLYDKIVEEVQIGDSNATKSN